MTESARDRLTGAILLVVAIVWTIACFWAIPGTRSGVDIGPRGFPLAMGLALGLLSILLLVKSFYWPQDDDAGAVADPPKELERWALYATFGFLAGYLLLLNWFGLVIGTIVATTGFLWFVLKQRSPVLLIGLPLGLTFGIWLLLGQLLGVYLPRGTIINIF